MTIAGLTIFPLKSARGMPVLSARVGSKGLLDDRSMMVVDETGCAITARAAPLLMQIRVVLDGDEVILLAPGRPPIGFRREELKPACGPVSVWGSEVSAGDAGDAVADWLCGHAGWWCRTTVIPAHSTSAVAGSSALPIPRRFCWPAPRRWKN
jgi:uncharacterized protein YcbX